MRPTIGHAYITIGCFERFVKTLDDIPADFVAQSLTGFKWILGYSTVFREDFLDFLAFLVQTLWPNFRKINWGNPH